MKTRAIAMILFSILLFNSCCRKERCKCEKEWGEEVDDCSPKHYGPYYLGEVKDYLYFKPGSYWVYQNDLSGQLDSIYTISCDTAFNEVKGKYYKWISLSYTSIKFWLRSDKYRIDYYYEEQKRVPDITDFSYGHALYRFPYHDSNSNFPHHCFSYPFTKSYSPLFKEFIPSMIIKGKTYTDVAIFELKLDKSVSMPTLSFPHSDYGLTRYYWSKGHGLVQIEQRLWRTDTQTEFWHKWELLRYKLNK
jgi:hypothetical protein